MMDSDEDTEMATNNTNASVKIPPTQALARRFFSRLDVDGEIPPIPNTDAERLCHDKPSHTTVS